MSKGDAPPTYGDSQKDSSSKAQRSSLEIPNLNPVRSRASSASSELSFEPSSLDKDQRRSFEDEHRPLPEGWIRQWDASSNHHYYVDTTTGRSIWEHPEDDEQFQTEEAQKESTGQKPRRKVGRLEKLKNKLSGTTHEERVAQKKKRADAERKAEQDWLKRRQEMQSRQQTAAAEQYNVGGETWGPAGPGYQQGNVRPATQPVYAGGAGPSGPGYYGGAYGGTYGYSGYGPPCYPYGRRGYGYGYGGGLYGGGLGLGGGLLGGLLLTDLLI